MRIGHPVRRIGQRVELLPVADPSRIGAAELKLTPAPFAFAQTVTGKPKTDPVMSLDASRIQIHTAPDAMAKRETARQTQKPGRAIGSGLRAGLRAGLLAPMRGAVCRAILAAYSERMAVTFRVRG